HPPIEAAVRAGVDLTLETDAGRAALAGVRKDRGHPVRLAVVVMAAAEPQAAGRALPGAPAVVAAVESCVETAGIERPRLERIDGEGGEDVDLELRVYHAAPGMAVVEALQDPRVAGPRVFIAQGRGDQAVRVARIGGEGERIGE